MNKLKTFMEHLEDVVKENGWDSIDEAYYGLTITPFMGLIQKAIENFEKELKELKFYNNVQIN